MSRMRYSRCRDDVEMNVDGRVAFSSRSVVDGRSFSFRLSFRFVLSLRSFSFRRLSSINCRVALLPSSLRRICRVFLSYIRCFEHRWERTEKRIENRKQNRQIQYTIQKQGTGNWKLATGLRKRGLNLSILSIIFLLSSIYGVYLQVHRAVRIVRVSGSVSFLSVVISIWRCLSAPKRWQMVSLIYFHRQSPGVPKVSPTGHLYFILYLNKVKEPDFMPNAITARIQQNTAEYTKQEYNWRLITLQWIPHRPVYKIRWSTARSTEHKQSRGVVWFGLMASWSEISVSA